MLSICSELLVSMNIFIIIIAHGSVYTLQEKTNYTDYGLILMEKMLKTGIKLKLYTRLLIIVGAYDYSNYRW